MGQLVTGRFAKFGNTDDKSQIIDAGAFGAWLELYPTKSLPIFWGHDHILDPLARPIGVTSAIDQLPDGVCLIDRDLTIHGLILIHRRNTGK